MVATPSKHAKSTKARDLRFGRRGGRWLPLLTDAQQAEAFATAIEDGRIVHAECICTYWWLAPCDIGTPCGSCAEPMRKVAA
jgi:hypothetical protein